MIRHTVVFRLKHAPGSPAERDFLAAAQALVSIPGVEKFELLRQVGKKCAYTFGLSMEFADAEVYAHYNDHPAHVLVIFDTPGDPHTDMVITPRDYEKFYKGWVPGMEPPAPGAAGA